MLNKELDGTGETLFTRDGSFSMLLNGTESVTGDDGNPTTVDIGYLVDKNGYYVMGWEADTDGTFDTTGDLSALRIDPYAFATSGVETTEGTLTLNLPAGEAEGHEETYNIDAFDSEGERKSIQLAFTRTANPNEWEISINGDVGDTVNSTTDTITFDSMAQFSGASDTYTVSVDFASGGSVSFPLDISNLTQFTGEFNPFSYTKNGFAASDMINVSFDSLGHVVGSFENDTFRNLYKLPLAIFPNANTLEAHSGNVYAETPESGEYQLVEAGSDGYAMFSPNTHELSNVDLGVEMEHMIITQTAYNAASTTFRTIDEMVETIRDLKR